MLKTILSIIASVLALFIANKKKAEATVTPEDKAAADEQKINDAIVTGDMSVINDEFNKLREADSTPGDSAK